MDGGASRRTDGVTLYVAAQEGERRRIAREIHNGVVQALANILVQLEVCERLVRADPLRAGEELRKLKAVARHSLGEIRRVLADLTPAELRESGPLPAIRRMLESLAGERGIDAGLTTRGRPRRFDEAVEVAVFRIVQEAINNIRKHASASRVRVRAAFGRRRLILIVRDNGKGFRVPDDLGSYRESGRLGLAGVAERVGLFRGRLRIRSAPGKGVALAVSLPVAGKFRPAEAGGTPRRRARGGQDQGADRR